MRDSATKSQPWATAALRDASFASRLINSAPRSRLGNLRDEHAAFDLIRFDQLEKRAEIAFAKTLVALAFDELEENWSDHRP